MLFEYTCILTQEHNVDVTIHKDVYNFTMWWEDEVLVQKRCMTEFCVVCISAAL